jgi:hypothetical protein
MLHDEEGREQERAKHHSSHGDNVWYHFRPITLPLVSSPHLAGQARLRGLLFPVRAQVHALAAALAADRAAAERRHVSLGRITRYVE